MSRSLSGTIGTSFAFVFSHIGGLVTVSLLPFILLTACTLGYFVSLGSRLDQAATGDYDAMAKAMESTGIDFLYMLAAGIVGMWFFTKVLRYYLADEAPSIIGTGGTIRSSLWMLLYWLGMMIMVYIPFVIVVTPVIVLLVAASEFLIVIAVVLLTLVMLWAVLRLGIGYAPIAVGERPNFFSGWSISRGRHIGLFLRYIGLSLIILIGLGVIVGVIGGLIYLVLGDVLLGMDSTVLSVAGAFIYMVIALAAYWPLVIFLGEAYLRLAERQRPVS